MALARSPVRRGGELRDPRNVTAAQLGGGPSRYGWFVYAPADPAAVPIPDDLRGVLRHARQQGAECVLFDCDAVPLNELPIRHPEFGADTEQRTAAARD